MQFRSATLQEILPLRHKVLKPFLELTECINDKDSLADTFHFAVWEDDHVICVGSWEQDTHPEFPAKKSYRLRGMATDPHHQGRGAGQLLLHESLKFLESQGCDFVWANARIKAFPFYEKLNFKFYGELFEIPKIGPHKVIYKRLISE